MLKNIQTNFKLKIIIAVFLTPILSLGVFIAPIEAEGTDHVVISEIQVAGLTATDEFVKLYNPTNSEIDISGWRLQYKSATGATWSNKTADGLPLSSVIMPHKFFLLSGKDYVGSIEPDYRHPANWGLADSGGHVRIINETGSEIDKVGYGSSADSAEVAPASVPSASQSIERKASANSTLESMSAGGVDEYLGNGWDSGDNSADFVLRTVPNPQNALSAAEPATGSSLAPDLTPTPTPTPSPSASSVSSTPFIQKNLPVAEAGADKEAVIGENIDFDGSDSFDPAGKDLIFSWDFGDKTGAKGINVSHVYGVIGEYNVNLRVNNGENISEDSLKLKIIAPEFSDKIILREILPNPPGADKDGEWIELFNSGDKRVNLLGWILSSSAKTSGKQYVFPSDRFIEPKKFLAIKRSESGLVLANEGGKVSLIWPAEKILSEVSYGSAKEGKSYAFINNSWQWADTPTPNKENSAKVFTVPSKENIATLADISKNINGQESVGGEDEAIGGIAVNSLLAKSAVLQLEKSASIEDFLNKLISEKVNNAISKAKANETGSPEKRSLLADNTGGSGITSIDQESACKDFCAESERNAFDRQKDIRNNPWFYGDIALSILSLFLVWRYQEVRKKLKQL